MIEKFDSNSGYLRVENYLPHNFLAEKIVLSSLLISYFVKKEFMNNAYIPCYVTHLKPFSKLLQ